MEYRGKTSDQVRELLGRYGIRATLLDEATRDPRTEHHAAASRADVWLQATNTALATAWSMPAWIRYTLTVCVSHIEDLAGCCGSCGRWADAAAQTEARRAIYETRH